MWRFYVVPSFPMYNCWCCCRMRCKDCDAQWCSHWLMTTPDQRKHWALVDHATQHFLLTIFRGHHFELQSGVFRLLSGRAIPTFNQFEYHQTLASGWSYRHGKLVRAPQSDTCTSWMNFNQVVAGGGVSESKNWALYGYNNDVERLM